MRTSFCFWTYFFFATRRSQKSDEDNKKKDEKCPIFVIHSFLPFCLEKRSAKSYLITFAAFNRFKPLSIIMLRVTCHTQSGWLGFFPIWAGKIQRRGSALSGAGVAGCTAPSLKAPNVAITAWGAVEKTFECWTVFLQSLYILKTAYCQNKAARKLRADCAGFLFFYNKDD